MPGLIGIGAIPDCAAAHQGGKGESLTRGFAFALEVLR
jgi:hypothetical protein